MSEIPIFDIPITAGVGTQIRAFQLAGGDYDQIMREARATAAAALNTWTATTTGTASQIAADVTRVSVLLVSQATGRVWLRFDSTIPTTAALMHWYLDPGDRWEVPVQWCQLAVSMAASVAGGQVNAALGTAA